MSQTIVSDPVATPQVEPAPRRAAAELRNPPGIQTAPAGGLLVVAWGAMLLSSILPDIIALQILHNPGALPLITGGRIAALALTVVGCLR